MRDTWEMTVRTAANTMLRHPDKIFDGLEAELYALLEQLDTPQDDQPGSTAKPDDAPLTAGKQNTSATGPNLPPGRG